MQASRDLECSAMQSMSLCVKGVQVGNSLCEDFKMVNTVATFKRKCKNCGPTICLNYIMYQDLYLCYTLSLNMNV